MQTFYGYKFGVGSIHEAAWIFCEDSDQMRRMRPYTPETISLRVTEFLRLCDLRTTPRYLPFTQLSPNYRSGYCHNNCEAEVCARGGKVVCGWMIWESPELIEAEFHAVVQRGGKLIDVTPRRDDDVRILFVPDRSRRATRVDRGSWDSWANFKLWHDVRFEPARAITIHDPSAFSPRAA